MQRAIGVCRPFKAGPLLPVRRPAARQAPRRLVLASAEPPQQEDKQQQDQEQNESRRRRLDDLKSSLRKMVRVWQSAARVPAKLAHALALEL